MEFPCNFQREKRITRADDIFKEEYLVKSNQVCARMKIEISDCHPTIAKNVLYCYKDLI
jgi:hypothetical protein